MESKAGFVNIIGNPNVGKSTLMNAMLGERLSIITSKAQTTRQRILGIYNEPGVQIVFSDLPGILKPKYKLQESMVKSINAALEDADILVYMTDVIEAPEKHAEYLDKINQLDIPLLLLINKIDLSDQDAVVALAEKWKTLLPKAETFFVSALNQFNIDGVFQRVKELLPESPPYYPGDEISDKPMRFFVAEMIREKALEKYRQEIPYSIEVQVESFKEEENIVRIEAVIHVDKPSQKGILIGKGGLALKKLGTEARESIEDFLQKKVFLKLFVKVSKNWRDNQHKLKSFGY
jgi:GTP-binding protein Era